MKIGYLMQTGGPDVREKPLTGPANHVLKVYRELQELGHEMHFLARYDGKIWRSIDLERFEPVFVRRYDQGLRRLIERLVRGVQSRGKLPYFNLFESLRFSEACCQELTNCDLFYERMGWMGYGAGLAARRSKIPLVLEVNNGDFVTELERLGVAPRGFQYDLAVWLMRRAVHRADFSIATGDGHRRRYIEWWGIHPDKVTTVENGSDVVHLLKRDRLRSFSNHVAEDGTITLVFVGAFEPWHGILILLAAFANAASQLPQLRLKIIGSGTLSQDVRNKIDELDIGDKVVLTGQLPVEEMAEHLVTSDIGLAPYCGWMEFSGLKLFDYKSAGLVSLASGIDGEPATLKHGVTGWIVPPCDEEALSKAILLLANNPELRHSIGRSARLEAEEQHSWTHTAHQIEEILYKVVLK